MISLFFFFFSSRRRHTRCALVTGVQTCALPIFWGAVIFYKDNMMSRCGVEPACAGSFQSFSRVYAGLLEVGAPNLRKAVRSERFSEGNSLRQHCSREGSYGGPTGYPNRQCAGQSYY